MRFYVLTDIEGASGVTTYAQAEHTQFGIDMLMNDVKAVVEGLLSNPENEVILYDEHMDGCNLLMEELPESVLCVRGKPLESPEWKGIAGGYDALVMVGFHARAGSKGALLPHTYSLRNRNIYVNGLPIGEIGIETMIAGERGVPLVLVSGDSAGVLEALKLVPQAVGVPVKIALGEMQAICYPPQKTAKMLKEAAMAIASTLPPAQPICATSPVRLEIALWEGAFLEGARKFAPDRFHACTDVMLFEGESLSQVWNTYLKLERRIDNEIGV